MENKEEIKRIDGKYYLVRELEMDGEPVPHESGMLQRVKSIDGYDCQHCVLFGTDICDVPCSPYGFMVRVLPENSEEKDEENLSNVEKTGKNLETEKEETTIEHQIGEIFEYNGEWYQCIKGDPIIDADGRMNCCEGCAISVSECVNFKCFDYERSDKELVIFKKLEKAGEPMKIHNRLVLKVKADAYKCMRCCFYSKGKCELTMQECEHYDCGEENKFIEIKQNEKDVEEINNPNFSNTEKIGKNLKPFDLQAAKSGKPVCTRDGRKARIVCFDAKGYRPIVALIEVDCEDDCTPEDVFLFTDKGYYNCEGITSDNDLMMLPEKKEGWVNIYRDCNGANITKDDNIYSSKEAAIASAQIIDRDNYVATTIINWEE